MKKNLTHHFLIATPNMPDERFQSSLVYICRHDNNGALGLVMNKPMHGHTVGRLLEDLDISVNVDSVMKALPLSGGPIYPEVGFILHTGLPKWASSFGIAENISVTTSQDVLEDIAHGCGVSCYNFCLGHARWDKKQLEEEIGQGDWLVCPADLDLLFNTPFHERWHKAGKKIGVDLDFLSSDIGHS